MVTDIVKILSFMEWLNRLDFVSLEKSWLRGEGGRMELKMRQKRWMAMTGCNNEGGIEWKGRVNKKRLFFICPLTHLGVSCHKAFVAGKSLYIFQKQPGKGREERSSKGLQWQLGRTCRDWRSWRGGTGRCYLCLCCSVICTPGKLLEGHLGGPLHSFQLFSQS